MRAVNLIPAQERGGASVGAGRSEGAAYAAIALVGGVAVMAFMYGSASHDVSADKGKAAAISAQVTQTQAEAASLAPYTSFLSLREQRMQAVTSLVDTRFDWAHAFHEFARVLPATVSVAALTGTVGGTGGSTSSAAAPAAAPAAGASASAATSATPPGSVPSFTIGGCATSQQEVARMITRLRLMDGVSAVTLQSSTKGAPGAGSAAAAGTPCPPDAPVFAATVVFDPLPTPPAKASSTKTVAVAVTSSTTPGAVTP